MAARRSITRALHRRSDNLAALLADRGVGPGSLVGLSTRRGIDMVVALVAIVKAGAAYFPIDPGYPVARKQFMLDDVEPQVVVATVEAVDTMPQDTRSPAALARRPGSAYRSGTLGSVASADTAAAASR